MKKITSEIIFNNHNNIVKKFKVRDGYVNKNTVQSSVERMDLTFNDQNCN